MAKDKLGHGSEAHREGHKPQVEHGKYGKGSEYHGILAAFHERERVGGTRDKARANNEKQLAMLNRK